MRETKMPLVREFTRLDGYQPAYTLEYDLEPGEQDGCRLTLRRTGLRNTVQVLRLPAPAAQGEKLVQYLYENAVQPELWQDVVREFFPLACPEEGGTTGE